MVYNVSPSQGKQALDEGPDLKYVHYVVAEAGSVKIAHMSAVSAETCLSRDTQAEICRWWWLLKGGSSGDITGP